MKSKELWWYNLGCFTCGAKTPDKRSKYCSKKCYSLDMTTWRGEKTSRWIDGKVSYEAVHSYLRNKYGSANMCEGVPGIRCRKSIYFDWAKKEGCKYEKKRENFIQLCKSCHRAYDMTEEKRLKAIKNLTWYKG